MARSVVDLSSALGLTSIAKDVEGIEDKEQLALLDALGCDNVQGYLFAEPMTSEAFVAAIARLRAARTPALQVH